VDELKKRLLEIWIGLEQNITDTAWRNRLCVLVFARRTDISNIDLTVAVEQRDIRINCQPE